MTGNCRFTKESIGSYAKTAIGIRIHLFLWPNTRYNVAPKATIIAVVEMNRVDKPIHKLRGNSPRRPFSEKGAVIIDKNINIDVKAADNEMASDIANTIKAMLLVKIGIPVS